MRMLVIYNNEREERGDKWSDPQRNRSFPEEMVGMWKWESRRTPTPLPGPEELVLCEGKINKNQPSVGRAISKRLSLKESPFKSKKNECFEVLMAGKFAGIPEEGFGMEERFEGLVYIRHRLNSTRMNERWWLLLRCDFGLTQKPGCMEPAAHWVSPPDVFCIPQT